MASNASGRLAGKLLNNQKRNNYLRVFGLMALLITLGVAGMLMRNGVALTHEEQVLDCHATGPLAHTHTAECYDTEGNLVCPLPELEAHAHDDSCYEVTRTLVCGQEEGEGHTHTDACYAEERTLVCGLQETVGEHVHGPGCFRNVTVPDNMPAQELAADLRVVDEDGNEQVALIVVAKAPEGALPEGCELRLSWADAAAVDQELLQAAVDAKVSERTLAQLQALDLRFVDAQGAEFKPEQPVTLRVQSELTVAGNELAVVQVADLKEGQQKPEAQLVEGVRLVNHDEADTTEGTEDTLELEAQENGQYVLARLEAALLEAEAEPQAQVEGAEEVPAEANGDTGEQQDADAAANDTCDAETATTDGNEASADDESASEADTAEDEPAMPAQSFQHKVSDAKGNEILRVNVEAPEGAFAEGTTMEARWLSPSEIEASVTEAVAQDGREVAAIQAVDITFKDADGAEVEPAVPVTVTLTSEQIAQEETDALIVHVDDEGVAEVVEALDAKELDKRDLSDEPNELVFDADAFSVYAIAYTVDFHWDVDGQTYDYSIAGGGVVSLRELLPALGVVNAAEVDAFVERIESVEFSDPELVQVAQVTEDTTAGQLVEQLAVEPSYSADLTEEQIAELAARELVAPDWALVSLQPFTSEETLTVTLKNGDQVRVAVTDDQVTDADSLESGEKYVLYIERDGHYYAINRQGQTVPVENDDLDALFDDDSNLWRFASKEDGTAHWDNSCSLLNGSNYIDVYYSLENWWTQPLTWQYRPTKEYPIAPAANGWEPIISLASAGDGGFYFRDLNDYSIYLAYVGGHVRTIVTSAYSFLHPYSTLPQPISVHFYRQGSEYTVDLKSNNDAYGHVQYTLDNNTVSTSSSTGMISLKTVKNENELKQVLANIVAVPENGYIFTGWTVSQSNSWNDNAVTDWGGSETSLTIKPTVNGDLVLQANFKPEKLYKFTVKTNDETMGTVGGGNENGVTVSEQVSFTSTTGVVINNTGKNEYELTATRKPLHKFVAWQLTDSSGNVVQTIDTETINPNTLSITQEGMTLTAIFRKKNDTEIDEGDIDPLLDSWKDEMTSDFVGVDKTAHVHDYNNRIYEIDLCASSGKWAVERSINLDFITDTSRSMYFPANLDYAINTYSTKEQNKAASSFTSLRQWLSDNAHDTNQVYYVITETTENENSATMYAVHYDTAKSKWIYTDSSYYYFTDGEAPSYTVERTGYEVPNGLTDSNGSGGLINKKLSGVIYTSSTVPANYKSHTKPSELTQYWSRLDYLQKAIMTATNTLKTIDEKSKIHLTTFNKGATNNGELGMPTYDEQSVYNKLLTEISPDGGTRQDRALWTARTGNSIDSTSDFDKEPDPDDLPGPSSAFKNNSDNQQFAIFITDGAPNITSTKNNFWTPNKIWQSINDQADALKALTDKSGKHLTLMTLGVGSNFVGDNKGKFDALASDPKYAENANNGGQIVKAIKDLVQSMVVKADLYGTVSDTLDPAFYPVDANYNPVTPNVYYDKDGNTHNTKPSDIPCYMWTKDSNGTWTITYYNQTFKWPERDGNGNIVTNGWEDSFYVKAKENFLGGNTIETNADGGTTFTGTHTILLDNDGQEIASTKKEIKDKNDNAKPVVKNDVPTPHVNVKQLMLTQNETEWRVYIETQVNPQPQIEELYNNIRVLEVVDSSTNNMITGSENMLFTPGTGTTPEMFLLKDAIGDLSSEQWAKLTGDPGYVDVTYKKYDHTTGVVRLTLTKEGDCADYGNHQTSSSQIDVETYVLTAQFIPYTVDEMIDAHDDVTATHDHLYHTTAQQLPGAVQTDGKPSVNKHIVDLFVRGLSITKTDETFGLGLPGAEFTFYRPATSEEVAANSEDLKTFNGKKYYPQQELTFDGNGVAYINGIKLLDKPRTTYYLLETKAPEGYIKRDDPIPVVLEVTDSYIPMPVATGSSPVPQATKPSGLYNWEEKAKLWLDTETGIMRTTGAYDPNNPATDLTHTGIEATSQYEVMYYRLSNNCGAELPAAGGSGTTVLYLIGVMMVILGGWHLARTRRAA